MEKSEEPILQPVEKRYPDHQWLMKGAFVTALLTNFGHTVTRIWDLFYDNWKNDALFADLKTTRETAKDALSLKAKTEPMTRSQFVEASKKIENAWSTNFNKRLKDSLGIESEGLGMLKGTWQRFSTLGNHTSAKLVFNTVFTTAAALGGYMLINQNASMKRDMRSMQDRLEEERDSAEQKPKER